MSRFVEDESGTWAVKAMYASLAIALIGAGFTFYHKASGTGSVSNKDLYFKCLSCGGVDTIVNKDFRVICHDYSQEYIDQVRETNPGVADQLQRMLDNPLDVQMGAPGTTPTLPSWGTTDFPLPCPKCGENSFCLSKECPGCKEIFITYDEEGNYNDECPKCGFSAIADKKVKRAEERRKALEKR